MDISPSRIGASLTAQLLDHMSRPTMKLSSPVGQAVKCCACFMCRVTLARGARAKCVDDDARALIMVAPTNLAAAALAREDTAQRAWHTTTHFAACTIAATKKVSMAARLSRRRVTTALYTSASLTRVSFQRA